MVSRGTYTGIITGSCICKSLRVAYERSPTADSHPADGVPVENHSPVSQEPGIMRNLWQARGPGRVSKASVGSVAQHKVGVSERLK